MKWARTSELRDAFAARPRVLVAVDVDGMRDALGPVLPDPLRLPQTNIRSAETVGDLQVSTSSPWNRCYRRRCKFTEGARHG